MNYLRSIFKLYSLLSLQRRRQILILIILMSIFSFLELLSIGAFIPLLTSFVSAKDSLGEYPFPFNYFSSTLKSENFLILITVVFMTITALSTTIRVYTSRKQWNLIYQITADISQLMFGKIVFQEYQFFLKSNSNNVISSANSNLQLLTGSTLIPIFNILGSALLAFILLIGLFLISASSGIITLVIIGLSYYYFLKSSKAALKTNSNLVVKSDSLRQKLLTESIGSIRDIIIDNTRDIFIKEYKINDSSYWQAISRSMFLSNYPRFILEGIALISFCLFSYFLNSYSSAYSSIPAIGSFALAANKLLPASQLLFMSISQMRFSYKAVKGILYYTTLSNNFKNNKIEEKKYSTLKLKEVCFSYDKNENKKILKEVSLEINRGEAIGILGSSGAGKSTLLDIMLGLISPDSGLLKINNESINERNIINWRKSIAHVPQTIYLRNSTIAENIAFGESINKIDFDLLNKVSKMSCLEKYIKNNKDGFYAQVGENGVNLSGGQRQRIGIARALYKKANFIFLDEATSALDNETELEIMDSMYNLVSSEGICMVAISHKKNILSRCNQIYIINNGKLLKV